jgi:predicted metal-dependent phosphoesterase TrpH
MHELTCVVHVHSTFSDGTATVPEIVDVARATGADAV